MAKELLRRPSRGAQIGLGVGHRGEPQLDVAAGEAEGEARGDPGHDVGEVVPVNRDELPFPKRLPRPARVAGQVGQHADDEWQLEVLHRSGDFHLVADPNPGRLAGRPVGG